MKKKPASKPGFFTVRVLIGMFILLADVVLALAAVGIAKAQYKQFTVNSSDSLVPPMFDCSKIHELGIDKQENLRARAIMVFCGLAQEDSDAPGSRFSQWLGTLVPAPPAYGGADVDLITGTETYPDVSQSTTFSAVNPDNPQQIVIAYNDSRGRNVSPINVSGASVSTDGGTTFIRLTNASGQSPFAATLGDPVVLYNRPTGTWYTVWLDQGCGSQGLGGYKSTTPWDPSPSSWTHYCVHSGSTDDRESGWADNNTASPFYGRMYVCWNDFARGQGIFVRYSTDNGLTWTDERQITTTFVRNVQITGDLVTGDAYIAGMDEMGGNSNFNRANKIYRSTDGGNTWTNTYTGPTFFGPGRVASGYFAYVYSSPSPAWPYMGWGQPAAINHVVHYVYAQCGQNVSCNTATDHGDVYYIRSTDSGLSFSAPFKLNTDTGIATQWEPNLSVSPSGILFAVWYDERTGGTCTAGANTPCYQMFSRKSNDNGVNWQPDMTFSDVVSPLPAQPASSYDYQVAVGNSHRTAWVDGRVAINGIQQQDAFTDSELTATPTPTATSTLTPTPTATATPTPTATPNGTPTPTPTPTFTSTPRPSPTPRVIPTPRNRPTPLPRP
jgi:hypothetical protein